MKFHSTYVWFAPAHSQLKAPRSQKRPDRKPQRNSRLITVTVFISSLRHCGRSVNHFLSWPKATCFISNKKKKNQPFFSAWCCSRQTLDHIQQRDTLSSTPSGPQQPHTCREDLCCHANEGIRDHVLHGNRNVELPCHVPVQTGLYALQLVT